MKRVCGIWIPVNIRMLISDKDYFQIVLMNIIWKLLTLDLLIFRVQSEIFKGGVISDRDTFTYPYIYTQ
jgi:hypothetical protein